jgi:hypothetical protein
MGGKWPGVRIPSVPRLHAAAGAVYDGDVSTRSPGAPPEDTPDEAAGAADDRPASAAGQPHDAVFRQILGDVAHAAEVVRSILPARVAAHIDWSTPFEPTHASMVGDDAGQRHGDLLFKVRLVDGRGAFVWVMFEHQSTVQRWMALRLSGMVQQLLEDWRRSHPGSRYVPAVLPVVLHHGPRPWRAPRSLLALADLSEQARADLAGHLLSLEFVLDDLHTAQDEDIDARPLGPLPRLLLVVLKHNRSPDLLSSLEAHAEDIRGLLASEHGRHGLFIAIRYTLRVNPHVDHDTLIRHLAPHVGPGLEQTMLTFEQLLRNEMRDEMRDEVRREVRDEVRREVRDEVRREGIEDGQRELLLRQLTRRFGSLPAVIASRVARASRDEIARWSDRILDATSLDDVFAAS